MDAYEREEEQLLEDYNAGRISLKEYNAQLRDMQCAYRAQANEAAQDAYDREMERW